MLALREVSLSFGGNHVLSNIDLDVREGELLAIIGPNGAGKTSLFNVLMRLYEPDGGRARLFGADLFALAPHDLAGLGVARTFQNLLVLKELSVLENVMLGAHARFAATLWSCALALPGTMRQEREVRGRALDALAFLGIAHLAAVPAGALPFGHQRMVEIARCLIARAAAHPVRRAVGRAERRRGGGALRDRGHHPVAARRHHPARCAHHEIRARCVGSHRRARPRRQDRRRGAGRGGERSGGDRGLSGSGANPPLKGRVAPRQRRRVG